MVARVLAQLELEPELGQELVQVFAPEPQPEPEPELVQEFAAVLLPEPEPRPGLEA